MIQQRDEKALDNKIRIAVYCHVSPDFMGQGETTFHTFKPVEACTQKYTSPIAGFDPSAINYSHGASQLLGYIIAPARTEAFTDRGGYDLIKTPADYVGVRLSAAVRLAQAGQHGLMWQAADAASLDC